MKKVIIDTDTVDDDAIAILTALRYFQVEAVTIVGGGVDFDQQVENALYTISLYNPKYKVPVYKGQRSPMFTLGNEQHQTAKDVHGEDGMGDSFFQKAEQRPEAQHAIDSIIERVKEDPGEITLLTIGALTNIAMALKKDPSIAKDIPHIYIMGGTNNSLGNITPAAEYNFYADPEAARIVLHSGIPITMVGWDMSTKYSIMDDKDHQEIEQLGTKGSKFFKEVNKTVKQFNKNIHRLNGTTHPDTLLVAIAANENLMTRSSHYYVDIETKGELTRGYNMVDINNRSGNTPNVRVCESVDREGFKRVLLEVLSSIK